MSIHPLFLRLPPARRIAAAALLAALAGCGYKGPLYLPPPGPPDQTLTVPPSAPQTTQDNTAQPAAANPQARP